MPLGTNGGSLTVVGGGTGVVPGTSRAVQNTGCTEHAEDATLRTGGRGADESWPIDELFPDRLEEGPLAPGGLEGRESNPCELGDGPEIRNRRKGDLPPPEITRQKVLRRHSGLRGHPVPLCPTVVRRVRRLLVNVSACRDLAPPRAGNRRGADVQPRSRPRLPASPRSERRAGTRPARSRRRACRRRAAGSASASRPGRRTPPSRERVARRSTRALPVAQRGDRTASSCRAATHALSSRGRPWHGRCPWQRAHRSRPGARRRGRIGGRRVDAMPRAVHPPSPRRGDCSTRPSTNYCVAFVRARR